MFVPWPIPAALGIATGAWAHGADLPVGAGGVGFAWIAGLVASVALARRLPDRRVWLLLPLLLPLGWLRASAREARPEPLAPLTGRTVELAGRSDGRLLRLTVPRGEVVALRPIGEVPRGRVRVRGRLRAARGLRNPGGFHERAWLRRRGGSHVLQVARVRPLATSPPPRGRADGTTGPGGSPALPTAAAASFRDRVRSALVGNLPPEEALLMRALVLGEREEAGDLRDVFARAGLAHLLALSGLHLGVLAGAAGLLLAPLGPARWAMVAGLAVAFAIWIGPTPSLIRAAAMTAALGISAAVGAGRPHAFAALALAAAGTLTMRPDWLGDVSFQLSYGSLLGILALGAPLARRFGTGRPSWHPLVWVPAGLAVSASATLATLPWTLSTFGEVPVLGPVVNLPALPLASLLVPLGLGAGFLGALWPPLAGPLLAVASPCASLLLAVADAGAHGPTAHWGEVAAVGRALWVLALAPWAWVVRGRLKPWRALCVTACATAASLVTPSPHPPTELVVLDVGQGDAFLLRLPGRREVLIDGGGTPFSDYDVGAGVVVPALRALGVDELELVVASHADADHVEGLATVLREMPALALAYGHAAPGRRAWDELVAVARARDVLLLPLRRGARIEMGEATLHVLHPTERRRGEINEDSVALRVEWRGRSWALLLGDVGARTEREFAIPPTPLLVAPHHGSGHSTSARLLAGATPETVAVSVGTNRYGHPSVDVLERVRAVGAAIRRTDEEGALRFAPGW